MCVIWEAILARWMSDLAEGRSRNLLCVNDQRDAQFLYWILFHNFCGNKLSIRIVHLFGHQHIAIRCTVHTTSNYEFIVSSKNGPYDFSPTCGAPDCKVKGIQRKIVNYMGFLEHQYIFFVLFTFPFNVKLASSEKDTSFGSKNLLRIDSWNHP